MSGPQSTTGPWFGVLAWPLKATDEDGPTFLAMFDARPEAVQCSANYSASGARSVVVEIIDLDAEKAQVEAAEKAILDESQQTCKLGAGCAELKRAVEAEHNLVFERVRQMALGCATVMDVVDTMDGLRPWPPEATGTSDCNRQGGTR
jgi:hypothetical protein